MTEIEKIELANKKGYKCNFKDGIITGPRGLTINATDSSGYIFLSLRNEYKRFEIKAHRFLFYNYYNYLPEQIDHINRVRSDNRIENLRQSNQYKNQWNRTGTKGYAKVKNKDRYRVVIRYNDTRKEVGRYNKEEEAHNAYLEAKKIYHII
jgi:hypothetical protein